jgi:hypothetical protein
MMQATLVLPETAVGTIEAAATRKPSRPYTLSLGATIRQDVAAGRILRRGRGGAATSSSS